MKAFLIDNTKKIGQVSVDDGLAGVKRLIRFDTVDSDEIDANGDLLFFDEDRRSNATSASIPDPDSSRHSGAVFRRSLKNAPESQRKYCPRAAMRPLWIHGTNGPPTSDIGSSCSRFLPRDALIEVVIGCGLGFGDRSRPARHRLSIAVGREPAPRAAVRWVRLGARGSRISARRAPGDEGDDGHLDCPTIAARQLLRWPSNTN